MPQDLYKLPKGWEWSDLDSACSLITDGAHASPKTSEAGKPYITVRDVDDAGNIDLDGCKKISKADFQKLIDGNCSPQEGAVLFSKDGTVGKVALVRGYDQFVVLSSLAILQPKTNLLWSEYLRYFMLSPLLQETAIGSKTGAAIKRIVLRTIKTLQIPLPPLAEQERIVEKIDALFSRIDDATARLNQILTHTQSLFASSLDQAFSQNRNRVKVSDISERIQYGFTTKAKDTGNALFLRITDIQDGAIDWDGVPSVSVSKDDLAKYQLHPNDLVFARSGATAGKSILIEKPPENAIFASYLIRVIPSAEIVDPRYLASYFQSPEYWQQVSSNVAGAAQPNINGTKLSNFEIPLPPLAEQQRIVEHLDGLSSRIQTLEKTTRERLDHLAALKASLLDAAFRGNL